MYILWRAFVVSPPNSRQLFNKMACTKGLWRICGVNNSEPDALPPYIEVTFIQILTVLYVLWRACVVSPHDSHSVIRSKLLTFCGGGSSQCCRNRTPSFQSTTNVWQFLAEPNHIQDSARWACPHRQETLALRLQLLVEILSEHHPPLSTLSKMFPPWRWFDPQIHIITLGHPISFNSS